MKKLLKGLAAFATFLMYIVLQMGALVTNSGSADGCGDSWPLCKGTFMPDWDYHAIIEFSHRLVSGLAGLVVVILAVWAWRFFRQQPVARWLGVAGAFLVAFQGGLGAAAVIWPQPKAVLALHFGISLLCFSTVLLLTVLIFQADRKAIQTRPPVDGLLGRWIWQITFFIYLVIYMGAYVRHLRASLACFGWPLCNGQLIPLLNGPTGANFLHRVGALLAIVMIVRLFLLTRKRAMERPDLRRAATWALVLILMQTIEGAFIAIGHLNLLTQMLHSAIITLFWGTLSYLCLLVVPRTKPLRE